MIREWIYRNARPLELAVWAYHFEKGDKERVLEILKMYQNEDGGFGHGLEADCLNPNSSPLQTWAATELLKNISFEDSNHRIIQGIIKYLSSGKDFNNNRWRNTVASNNDYPRAPWWSYDDDKGNDSFNPSASLAGFILKHTDESYPIYATAKMIAKEAIDHVVSGKQSDEMHEIACHIELLDYIKSSQSEIETQAYETSLKKLVHETIEKDHEKWTAYVCKPSHYFNSPKSIFYDGNEASVKYELSHLQNTRDENGIWPIPWEWGAFESDFAVSKNWWKSIKAIQYQIFLKNFGVNL